MSNISSNLAEVRRHIQQIAVRSGRSPDDITLVAVSKTRSLADVKLALEAGQKDFGENTVQDALSKIPDLETTGSVWHFIGHLQSKKARQVAAHFQWIHSVDSLKLARKLSSAMNSTAADRNLNCLIQVNVSEEDSKFGLKTDRVMPFMEELLKQDLPGLDWRGLMTIGVQGDDSQTRAAFSGLKQLLEQCQQAFGLEKFDRLSMGMTHDYPIAIEEGATMVRIGTAIFGRRDVGV